MTSAAVLAALPEHWRACGLPGFAQFDNDPGSTASHGQPDIIGPVVRLCLSLGVRPAFVPRARPASRRPSRA